MSQTDTTTTRLSREQLLNLIYEAPQYNSGIMQIVDNVVALLNERDAYMTALEKAEKDISFALGSVLTDAALLEDLREEIRKVLL